MTSAGSNDRSAQGHSPPGSPLPDSPPPESPPPDSLRADSPLHESPLSGGGAARPDARAGSSPPGLGFRLRAAVRNEAQAYADGQDRPVGSYVALMAAYGAMASGLAATIRLSGRSLPDRFAPGDLALVAVASHKLARLVSKDPVTSPLRVPFTRFEGTSGEAELAEEVRGDGMRHAVGELLTCPFCLDQWMATGLVFGLVLMPRTTRLVAGLFSVVAAADGLQHAYAKLQG